MDHPLDSAEVAPQGDVTRIVGRCRDCGAVGVYEVFGPGPWAQIPGVTCPNSGRPLVVDVEGIADAAGNLVSEPAPAFSLERAGEPKG